jgi:hypothetical protein
MLIKKTLKMIVPVLLVAGTSVSTAFAQTSEDTSLDVSKIDCRTLLQMGGEDRSATLAFFHGLVHGKNNQMMINKVALSETTDKVVDHCIDNPQDTLLSAFEKHISTP